MLTSAKGREGLLGSIAKKKKFSFIGGGIAAVLSIPLMIFAPAADPNAVSAYCESALTDARQRCSDTVSDVDGEKYTWTVTKPGEYELSVIAPQKKISLVPQLVVKDAKGEELLNEVGPMAGTASGKITVAAGTYEIAVIPADAYMVKGGYSFDLEIKSLTVDAPAVAKADGDDAKAEEKQDGAAYTDEQLASRVDDLNEICGDTYCEGSFDYQFKKLACADATHCVLSFTAKNQDKKNAKPMDVELEIAGFSKLSPSADEEFKYEGSFDEAVGNALMKWEEHPVAKKVAAAKSIAAPAKADKKQKSKAVAPAPKPNKKAEVAPKLEKKSAPEKKTTIAAAPVAPVQKKTAAAPVVAAPSSNRTSKNLED
jgi:hypothetical protein